MSIRADADKFTEPLLWLASVSCTLWRFNGLPDRATLETITGLACREPLTRHRMLVMLCLLFLVTETSYSAPFKSMSCEALFGDADNR